MNTKTLKASRKWCLIALAAVFALGMIVSDVSATILLARTNTVPQGDTVAPFPATNLLLGSATTLSFSTTTANQLVRVIFNAECSVGGAVTNWLDSTIYIDPAGALAEFPVAPSNSDNALCSGNGTATENDGWVSAVTQVWTTLQSPGVHIIRVEVTPSAAVAWRIDDLSIVIDTQ